MRSVGWGTGLRVMKPGFGLSVPCSATDLLCDLRQVPSPLVPFLTLICLVIINPSEQGLYFSLYLCSAEHSGVSLAIVICIIAIIFCGVTCLELNTLGIRGSR